jgi:hypothetical protein
MNRLAICRGQWMKRLVEGADRGQWTLLPDASMSGSRIAIQYVWRIPLSPRSIWPISVSKASSLQRQGGLPTPLGSSEALHLRLPTYRLGDKAHRPRGRSRGCAYLGYYAVGHAVIALKSAGSPR